MRLVSPKRKKHEGGFGTFSKVINDIPLTTQAYALYCCLCSYGGANTTCWPNQKTLANAIGLKNRQGAARYTKELIHWELIQITHPFPENRRKKAYVILDIQPSDLLNLLHRKKIDPVTPK